MSKSSKSSSSNEKVIIDYLAEQNRPYSAQDLLNNLEGKIGKTELVNKLEKLAGENKIIEKVYGKQKVYMALQNVDITTVKSDLRQLDERIVLTNGDLTRLQTENARIESQLKSFESKIPISELRRRVEEMKTSIANSKSQIDEVKSTNRPLISKEDKIKTQREFEKYCKEWRKLKRIANEMMATIKENCNIKKDQLCEDLGIILDEHENVQPFS